MGIYLGKIWFESFEFHFDKRKSYEQLIYRTRKEYKKKTVNTVLEYDKVFYMNERNGQYKWIEKLYFFKDDWVVIFKITDYDYTINTSFKLTEYRDYAHYLKQRGNIYLDGEVKDGSYHKRIIESIQERIEY